MRNPNKKWPKLTPTKKQVKVKKFVEGDLVWKTILPIGTKDPKYGKWVPNWEGPFVISKVYDEGVYQLANMEGEEYIRGTNGRYLKKYYHVERGSVICVTSSHFSRIDR